MDRNGILKTVGVVLLLFSILLIYISFSQPLYRVDVVNKGYYSFESNYNFSAEMDPNVVYGKQKINHDGFFQKKFNIN